MFNTKKDVDKHVRASLGKLRTDSERNVRGYTIAKLYYKIGEYTSALHYVTAYLSVKKDSSLAYKLQGQCYEKMNKIDQALQAYQISLQVNNAQPDLLTDLCKLALNSNVQLNPAKARYWCQMAEKLNVQNESILNLKLKLLNKDTASGVSTPNQVEELILKEIIGRPLDVTLRIRLIEHYLEQNQLSEAFSQAYDIETKQQNETFTLSLDWYNALSVMLTKYRSKETNLGWPYWLMSITTVERQLFLMLCLNTSNSSQPYSSLNDCIQLLFEFDQMLENFAKNFINVCPELELAAQFLSHFRGQFCLHAATLIFKRELAQQSQWKEATNCALPLLLLAYNCGTASTDEIWLRNSIESRRIIQLLSQHGAFRCSQAGRTLLSCLDDNKPNEIVANIRKICSGQSNWTDEEDLIKQMRKFCSNSDWRKQIFKYLFKSNHLIKQKTSFFMNCSVLSEPTYDLPSHADLEKYELIAQWLYQSHLPFVVYLTLETTTLSDVKCCMFKGLNFSISNLLNCGPETLNQLDVESFLYATTLQTKRKFEIKQKNGMVSLRPSFLPYPIISNDLCTAEQQNWWSAAYKVFKNISGDEIGEIRTILQYGIEAVRAIGGPKMDLMIALQLGEIFQQRARDAMKLAERGFLEARVEALYKYSLQFIKIWNNRSMEPCPRFFKYAAGSNDIELRTNQMAEVAITFLAEKYFKNHEYEECIDELANVQLPFAKYFQAEAYRKLNESSKARKINKPIYIEKAIECLNQTLNLLKYPTIDPNHPLKSIVNTDIERLQQLNNAESSFANGSQFVDEFLDSSHQSTRSRRHLEQPNTTEMEAMLRKMMDMLSLVKEEVMDVKIEMNGIQTKLQNIEEQVNKKQDTNSVDPNGVLDDYFIIDDELQSQGFINNSSASMYPSYGSQRMHTPNQIITPLLSGPGNQQQQQPPQQVINPYGSPFYNNMYQMGLNPYQAALMNPQRVQLPYADPNLAYGIQTSDPRNSVLGLLTQQQQTSVSTPTMVQQPQLQQTISTAIQSIQTLPMTQNIQQQPHQTTPLLDKTGPNSSILKTWNSAYNNVPVEKSPPVNVVITNSDPLPHHSTITTQPALSVTIPSHHIKNNSGTNNLDHGQIYGANVQPSDMMGFKLKQAEVEKDTEKTESTQTPISIFGNHFSSTPNPSPNQDKPKEDNANKTTKPNPFANFSFGAQTTTTAGIQPDKSITNIFSGLSKVQPKTTYTAATSSLPQPPNKAQPVKDNSEDHLNTSRGAGNDEPIDDYVPTAQFEPVIALPNLIEVTTGEENEIIKFEHRAKLLRFDKDLSEWKERGVGNIKILVQKNDPNKVRLLMRRDQVLKLCCNQFISADTKFTPLPILETALSWYGQDYSENELQVEILAVRFKTAEICKQFHAAILEAQKNMSSGRLVLNDQKSKNDNQKSIGFGDRFKPKAGAWNCQSCYLSNNADAQVCIACNASKLQSNTNTKSASKSIGEKPKKSTELQGFGDKFKPKPGSWTCQLCYIANTADVLYCPACDSPKDETVPKKEPENILSTVSKQKFTFGIPATGNHPAATTITNTFPFGTFTAMTTTNTTGSIFSINSAPKTGGFTLNQTKEKSVQSPLLPVPPSMQPLTSSPTPAITSSVKSFDQPAKFEPKESFSFVFKPKSPGKAKSPIKPIIVSGAEDVSDDENIEEENNTYFTPVIPLPDKIELKTGEEDEDILYSHRCKLFRFVDSEWKERGLGDLKILRHKQTAKLRIVMRREQILKICLNHMLTDDIEYKPKDEKSWHFVVIDFSDGEVQPMQFCLRFKNKEIAQGFKEAVDNALYGNDGSILQGKISNADNIPESITVSDELKKKSAELQLPLDFFVAHSATSTCDGCRGCNSDDFEFPEYKNVPAATNDDINPLPLIMPVKSNLLTPGKDLLQKSAFSLSSFDNKLNIATKNIDVNQTKTKQNLFNITSFVATDKKTNSIFSTINPEGSATPTLKDVPTIFGGQTNMTSTFGVSLSTIKPPETKSPIFGQTNSLPLFGFGALDTNEKSAAKTQIFGENCITPVFGASNADENIKPTGGTSFLFGGGNSNKVSDVKTTISTPASGFSFENTFASTTPFATKSTAPITTIFAGNNGSNNSTGSDSTSTGKPVDKPFSSQIFGTQTHLNSTKDNATKTESTTAPISQSNDTSNVSISIAPSLDMQKSIFSDSKPKDENKPLFGSSVGFAPTFGSTTLNSFGSSSQTSDKNDKTKFTSIDTPSSTTTTFETIFKTDPTLTFASLAKSSGTAFKSATVPSESTTNNLQGFYGLSTKDDFSNFSGGTQTDKNNKSINGSKNDDSNTDENNYDPHYDPIIALPDEIVVTTGEEDEEKLFGERAKIYRYDTTTKQWKERGVGELKILYHATKGRYRLLQRREQVFKCIVNQAISSDLVVNQMKASDTAFCWAANNFADESNGDVEQLSARFKNTEIANRFYQIINQCIDQLKSRTGIEPEED